MDEGSAQSPMEQARAHLAALRPEEALGVLGQLGEQASNADALVLRGECLIAMGRIYEARLLANRLETDGCKVEAVRLRHILSTTHPMETEGPTVVPHSPRRMRNSALVPLFWLAIVVVVGLGIGFVVSLVRQRLPQEPVATQEAYVLPPAAPTPSLSTSVSELDAQDLISALTDPAARDLAMNRLVEEGYAERLPELYPLLRHADGDVRLCAVRLIARKPEPSSLDPLRKAVIKDPWRSVRSAAARGLARLGGEAACNTLAQAFQRDTSTWVRKEAACVLYRADEERALTLFKAMTTMEPSTEIRQLTDWLTNRVDLGTPPIELTPGRVAYGAYEGTQYLVYLPSDYTEAATWPVTVLIHGNNGDPVDYMSQYLPVAESLGTVLVAPWFDHLDFPDYERLFSEGPDTRSDTRVLEIVDHLRQGLSLATGKLQFVGYDRGAEWVCRFCLAHPERVARGIACAPNRFIMPDDTRSFPWGTAPHPFDPSLQNLKYTNLVTSPLIIITGAHDAPATLRATDEFLAAQEQCAVNNGFLSAIVHKRIPNADHTSTAFVPTISALLTNE